MKTCDLHTHSTASDGTCTPAEIIDAAIEAGLSAVALTDHNTTNGLAEFSAAAKRRNAEGADIEAICGCEFTTHNDEHEIHLLGLFLPQQKWPEIEDFFKKVFQGKEQANRQCVKRLQEAGYPVSYQKLLNRFPDVGTLNRFNIAILLHEAGAIEDPRKEVYGLLRDNGDFYIPAPKPAFLDTIAQIRAWGGAAVWGHPFGIPGMSAQELAALMPLAKEHGLVGAECMYTTYSDEDQATLEEICKRFDIVATGSTDFHGTNKKGVKIGTGFGDLCIPYSVVEKLKAAINL